MGASFAIGTTTVNCSGSDAHGNRTIGSFGVTVRDTTPPMLTLPPPLFVEATSPAGATVGFVAAASDGVSGVVTPTCLPVPGTAFSLGLHTVNCTAVDGAGNSATGSFVVTVRDTLPPNIFINAPIATTFLLNQVIASSYSCQDSGSGVASCTGPVASAADVPTTTVGTHTFTVAAADNVGNASTQSVQYSVNYNVCPFFDQTKAVKSGATIPIKLRLCGAASANVSAPAVSATAVRLVPVSGTVTGQVEDAGNANPDNNFRYDASLAGYIFNLKTKGLATGIWKLEFTAGGDGATHAVQFQVR